MRRLLGHGALFLVVLAFVSGLAMAVFVLPAQAQRDEMAERVRKLEGEIQALEGTRDKLPDFDADVRRLEAAFARFARLLPPRIDVEAFMGGLEASARDLGLVLSTLRWDKARKEEFAVLAPFTVEVRGTPDRAMLFASRIVAGEPLVELRSILLESPSPGQCVLTLRGAAVSVPPQ